MSKTKKLIAALFIYLNASSSLFAMENIGIVDVQAVFQALPQAPVIQQNIAEEYKDQMEALNRLEKEFQYYMEKYQLEKAEMSQQEAAELEEKIVALRQQYEESATPLQQQMQARAAEERNKLLGAIKKAVDSISMEEGYTIVFNAEAVAFQIDDSRDISQKVVDRVSQLR